MLGFDFYIYYLTKYRVNLIRPVTISGSMILDNDAELKRKNTEKFIKESYDPQNVGRMSDPDGFGEITGSCGDTMEFYVKAKGNIIEDVQFYTDGCGTTIACGSITTQMAKGKDIGQAIEISDQDVIKELGDLPEDHHHCAKLSADTLKKALTNYLTKK